MDKLPDPVLNHIVSSMYTGAQEAQQEDSKKGCTTRFDLKLQKGQTRLHSYFWKARGKSTEMAKLLVYRILFKMSF